jgi:mono/diheme cytochrome c family protein
MKISMAVVLLVVLVPLSAASQSAPPPPEPYRPGLGDLMTMTVQPRHIKLLLAGHEQNWPYAKYELKELQEAFERAVRVWPRFRGLPMGGMIDAIAKGPMDELAKAIDAKDEVAFDAGYQKLTEGCNACHQVQRRNGGDQGAKRIELPQPGFPAAQAVTSISGSSSANCRACFQPLR